MGCSTLADCDGYQNRPFLELQVEREKFSPVVERTGSFVRGKGRACTGPSGAGVQLALVVMLGRAGGLAEAERVLEAMNTPVE